MVPVIDEFVLNSILVGKQRVKGCETLFGCVVKSKQIFLAIFNERIAVVIVPEVVVAQALAKANFLK